MNKHISKFIGFVDYAYNRGVYYIDVPKTASCESLCEILLSEGIITYFYTLINTRRRVLIRIHLNNQYYRKNRYIVKPYTQILLNSKSCNEKYLSYFNLKRTFKFNTIRVFSTDKGYLTCKDMLKIKCGGILLFTICF